MCRGRRGRREARLKRAAHTANGDCRGDTRHATPKRLWGLFVSHSDAIFREMEQLYLLCFLPMIISVIYIQHYTFCIINSPSILLKLERSLKFCLIKNSDIPLKLNQRDAFRPIQVSKYHQSESIN